MKYRYIKPNTIITAGIKRGEMGDIEAERHRERGAIDIFRGLIHKAIIIK
jgi:hypothetical protein